MNLHNRLLSICASARGYRFNIFSWRYEQSVRKLIASLLQMEEIKRCQNIDIDFRLYYGGNEKQLPVDEVSNWLERSSNGIEKFVNNKQKARSLKMQMKGIQIQNAREMIEHLKTV